MPLSRLDRAIIGVARAHRRRAAAALAPIGLHPGQDVLLSVLRRRRAATQAQLARILRIEPPTLAIMVRRLEASGFVTRTADPRDARVKVVALTEQGLVAADAADRVWDEVARVTRAALGDADADEFIRVLERLVRGLDGAGDDARPR